MVRAATTSRLLAALKSFWFLPSALGLLGLLLAGASVWIDRTYSDVVPIFQSLGAVTTRTVLQTIATASITVISLTYSMTLVVFTLAAGNIGPRLLTGFRESTLTRVSVGVFCCTFLFAMTVLNFVGDEHTPRLSALIAFVLSIISVYVLIIYVHHVSSEVLVDNEIAKTAERIRAGISGFFSEHQGSSSDSQHRAVREPGEPLKARETGYVRMVETDCIVEAASKHRCFVDLKVSPGAFVVEGMPVALVHGCDRREVEDAIVCGAIVLGPSRQPDADISFSFHLLIEIALRALSPGVNDTYTALSCIDYLSAALSLLLNKEPPASIYCDDAGKPRLHFEVLDIRELLESTLRPLRVSARGNLLVSRKLLQALFTMKQLCLPRYRDILQNHIDLVLTDAKNYIKHQNDLGYVTSGYAENEKEEHVAP